MSRRSDVPRDPQQDAFVLHRREQPPTPVQRWARMALRGGDSPAAGCDADRSGGKAAAARAMTVQPRDQGWSVRDAASDGGGRSADES